MSSGLSTARTGSPSLPFVLKPVINFQLKNELAGTDYGTLSLGMNRLHVDSINGLSTWMDAFVEEFTNLPDDLKKWNNAEDDSVDHYIAPIHNLRFDDGAYDIFVDVFASQSGYLNFEPEVKLGRPLTDQRLFTISARGRREQDVTQFFNPGDWMASDTAFSTEPFDKRVAPSLWCGKFDTEDGLDITRNYQNFIKRIVGMPCTALCCAAGCFLGCLRRKYDRRVIYGRAKDLLRSEQLWENRWLLDEDSVKDRCTPRHAWDLQLNKPKGPSELLEGAFGLSVHSVKKSMAAPKTSMGGLLDKTTDRVLSSQRKGEKVILRHARTGELQKELRKAGWRSTSHLVAPETNLEKNTLFTDLVQSGKATLQHNMHTFVRPVGHVISDGDRDSRILARLRMGLPTHHIAEIKRQLEQAKQDLDDMKKGVETMRQHLPARQPVRRSNSSALGEEEDEKMRRLARVIANMQVRMDKLIAAEKNNCNFLLVKFKRRGMVIWSAPDHIYSWS